MPLTMTKAGDTVTIRKITGKDEVRQHLAELGFVVGETVNTRPAASAAVTAPAGAAAAAVTAAAQVIVRPAAVPATVSKA